MKKNQTYKSKNYDFSDYAEEIKGDALFKINGGAEVENSHQGVANAQVGDTITRNSGEVVVLKQADIDYAQQQLGTYGNQETNNTSTGTQNYSGGSNQTTATINTTKEEKQSLMYDPHDPSRVIVDLDDPKAMQQAANLLADPSLGLRVTAYGSESGITKNFKNYKEINDYLNTVKAENRWEKANESGITPLRVLNEVIGQSGLDIWNSVPKHTLSIEGRSGSFPIIGICYDSDTVENPLNNVNTFVHEVYHQVQYNENKNAFMQLLGEFLINEKKSRFDNIDNYTYRYDKNNIENYTSLSNLPYLESQAEFVGDYGSLYYKSRYGNGVNPYEEKALRQMVEVMKNSGYGDTEAVKWIEN